MRNEPEKDTPETDMNNTPTPRTDIDTICDAIASKLNDAFNLYAWDDSKTHAKQIVMDGIYTIIIRFETELTAVTEQRDRLVTALEKILDYQGRFAEEDPKSIATEALQSLNQNENCDATRSVEHP